MLSFVLVSVYVACVDVSGVCGYTLPQPGLSLRPGHTEIVTRGMVKRSESYPGAKAYYHCYDVFMQLYQDNRWSYYGVCHARSKLKLCKEKVMQDFPGIENVITHQFSLEPEVTADFWCTYNVTHHKPAVPFSSMEAMYNTYYECPYVTSLLLSHEDYSPKVDLGFGRAQLAGSILDYTGSYGLSKWQPLHKYDDPQDPVHKALSAIWCHMNRYEGYRVKMLKRYCVVVADIASDLHDAMYAVDRRSYEGLYNWTEKDCAENEDDPLELVMRLSQLEKAFQRRQNTALSPCHKYNIYVRGVACLLMFYTALPPFSDLHNFMHPFVKNVDTLNSCWERITSACPRSNSNTNRVLSLLIHMYNLACDLSKQNGTDVWHVIYAWADEYKKKDLAQRTLAAMHQFLSSRGSKASQPNILLFSNSLDVVLKKHGGFSPKVTTLFSQLSNDLRALSQERTHGSGSIFLDFAAMDFNVLSLLLTSVQPLFELFVEVGQFVEYDRQRPLWWWRWWHWSHQH